MEGERQGLEEIRRNTQAKTPSKNPPYQGDFGSPQL